MAPTAAAKKAAVPSSRKRSAESILLNSVKRARVPTDSSEHDEHADHDHDHDRANATTPSSAPSLADDTASITATEFTTATGKSKNKYAPREKKIPCTFEGCTKMFSRPVHLQNHINSHTGQRPHLCTEPDCDKTFMKREHLVRHIQDKHGTETFTCTFTTRNHVTGVLEPCNKVFSSTHRYKRHFAVHKQKEETTCTWDNCNMVFRKQETLQRHIKKDHLHEDPYICKRTTTDGGSCGQSFPTPGLLKSHVAREHEAPRYYCKICTCAANPLTEADILRPVQNDLDDEFLPTPDDTLAAREGVESDIMQNLNLNDEPIMLPPEALVSFPTYHELQRHTTLMHPPTCHVCGKQCKTAKELAAHIDIQHPPDGQRRELEKRFVCPYDDCVRSNIENGFSKKGNMDAHVRAVHTKKRDFICGEYDLTGNPKVERWNRKGCGQALTTKQSLIGHIRTQHLGIPVSDKSTGIDIVPRPKRGKPSPLSQQIHAESEDSDEDEDEDEHDYDRMDVDKPSAKPSEVLAMLTGSGYDDLRPVACLKAGCKGRFNTEYEMSYHLELTHGWSVEDINEATGREETEFLSSEELRMRKQIADMTTGRQEKDFLSSEELRRRNAEANGRVDPQLA